ncbi:retrovirus-related pol polyprotein from transposon tnt 1-94 [Lasius niger]|uniref:Retrovirus-related pol polyprotein from transposon tnt 1-94 n=1 Tax=Lasius niger TaxID=67767 RepID=A0A0J7MMJ5_LASNI|nr:retrovirus-related pol polyprotein from transposon tnt 1-94 [Lasius niger]
MCRAPFKEKGTRATTLLELIHSGLCGPMETIAFGGYRYFLTLIDDYSRKVFVYFLKNKSEVPDIFEVFKAMVEKENGQTIKCLCSDNGGEYSSTRYEEFLKKNGIKHQKTVPYTPQQYGTAERANRSIVEEARSLLNEAGLDKRFWSEAVNTAVYLLNRLPTRALHQAMW